LKITVEAANQAFAQYVPRDAIEADMVEQMLLLRARISSATARVLSPDLPPAVAARTDRTINTMTRELCGLIGRLELRQNRPTWNLPQQYWRIEPIRDVGPVMEANPPMTVTRPIGGDMSDAAQAATMAFPGSLADASVAQEPDSLLMDKEPVFDRPATDSATAFATLTPDHASGDALARFASMRLPPEMPVEEAWMIAARAATDAASGQEATRQTPEGQTTAARQAPMGQGSAGQGSANRKLRRARANRRAA
jgi:hypothetical protein